MSKCKHQRLVWEHRKDKYGRNHKCKCTCGKVSSNWHTEIRRAKIGFRQELEDKIQRGVIEPPWRY